MEFQKLPAIVLILVFVGMLIGIGVLTFDKIGYSQRVSTTVAYTAQNVTLAGGVGTLTNGYVDSFTRIGNSTVNTTNVNITDSLNGVILAPFPTYANGTYYVGYVYNASSPTTTAFTAGTTAVGGIASNWMALIVVIIVLAVVLTFVIRSFGGKAR